MMFGDYRIQAKRRSAGKNLVLAACRESVAMGFALLCSMQCHAQSTLGTVLGTITDPTGAVIPKANVQLLNTGTNAVRETTSNAEGLYQFTNIDVGTYRLRVSAGGFQSVEYSAFDLSARATVRVDLNLKLASQTSQVEVSAAVNVIQTDVSNIAESKGSRELNDLPVAVYTRSQGSTSAYSTLTAQPGVQTDSNKALMVGGATPSMISMTLDGVSTSAPGRGV